MNPDINGTQLKIAGRVAALLGVVLLLAACSPADIEPPDDDPDPDQTLITSFTTSAAFIDRGDSITLNWAVENPASPSQTDEPCTIASQPQGADRDAPVAVDCTGELTTTPVAPEGSAFVNYILDAVKAIDDASGTSVTRVVTVYFRAAPSDPGEPTGDTLWAKQFGTAADDEARDVAVTTDGYAYVVGTTAGTLGDGSFGGIDAFVRKYEPDGDVEWTVQFGTPEDDVANAVAVDDDGNVFVAGSTGGVLDGSAGNAGGTDGYVLKYDSAGDHLWSVQFGTLADDTVNALALTANDELILVGTTEGDLSRTVEGASDIFVRRLDQDGDHLWTQMFGGGGTDSGNAVATGPDGIFVVGSLEDTADGDPTMESRDGKLLKLATTGTEAWSYDIELEDLDIANGVALDEDGSAYVSVDTFERISGDIFTQVVKVDEDGDEVWTSSIAGITNADETSFHDQAASDVTIDANGDVIVNARVLTTLEDETIVVGARLEKIDPTTGDRIWFNDNGHDDGISVPTGVAVDAAGNLYLSGYTSAPLFASNLGGIDAFVLKTAR